MPKKPRDRRTFTDKFKQHIVDLYQTGYTRQEIIDKYDLTPSAFDRWIKQHRDSGQFKEIELMSDLERENLELRKQNEKLRMENDILKQAALILANKKDM